MSLFIKRVLITGGSQGLGAALVKEFSSHGIYIYALGRDREKLHQLAAGSDLIRPIHADITRQADRKRIPELIGNEPLSVIHNAAMVIPNTFENISAQELQQHFEVNVFSPFLLTKNLLQFIHRQRVLNITSGAAQIPLDGLLSYCASKAAFEHMMRCINKELQLSDCSFANLTPGMVDTAMQENFRNCDPQRLPGKEYYLQIRKQKKLISPMLAAKFIYWVMSATTATDFTDKTWRIYDKSHHQYWLPHGERIISV